MMRVCATERNGLLVCACVLKKSVRTKNTIISMIVLDKYATLSCIFFKCMLGFKCVFRVSSLMYMNIAEAGKMIDKDSGVLVAPTCQFVRLISMILSNQSSNCRFELVDRHTIARLESWSDGRNLLGSAPRAPMRHTILATRTFGVISALRHALRQYANFRSVDDDPEW